MRTCPHCHADVKEENFDRHLTRVHGITSGGSGRTAASKAGYLLVGAVVVAVMIAVLAFTIQNRQAQAPRTTATAGASAAPGTRVGDVAPEFRVVDINGRSVTHASLTSGKPGLIFFTATWCLPCIEGLRHLTAFQRDIGGEPFNVLIVFIDPRETNDDLRAYRDRFGFPVSWFYALDTDDMVLTYRIRYLDTKFVVDRNGVVRYTDVWPADYNTWRRALATVGISR